MKKTAVVTGAGAGIGAAIASRLADQGLQVALLDRQPQGIETLAATIRERGQAAAAHCVDVSAKTDIDSTMEAVRTELGPILVMVNNAGVSPERDFLDVTETDFDQLIDINLKGLFFCTQAVVPDMCSANWGRIINISSSSAQSGAPRMSHYAASKGGVIGFTKALAMELGHHGITVNNVPPSFVHTDGLESISDRIPGGIESFAQRAIPMRRVGHPEDIAAAVAFLASEQAGYITGHTLSVNGGRYMM